MVGRWVLKQGGMGRGVGGILTFFKGAVCGVGYYNVVTIGHRITTCITNFP